MIVYCQTKENFQRDVFNGVIAKNIKDLFVELGIPGGQEAEYRSWKESLFRMAAIMADNRIDKEVKVAIEFQIPLTSKRIDFMIGGSNETNDHIVVIELKQWEKCLATDMDNLVNTWVGGSYRDVVHPSQQAYSYAKLIENFNASVQDENIELNPCAYLHNYENEYKSQILSVQYQNIIKLAPVFLMEDAGKLADFIVKYVHKPSSKNLFKIIDYGKLRPSKSLQNSIGSILNGNTEFELIDDQVVAYSTILKIFKENIEKDEKHTIIVQGGPGTGKSVIAINLLAKIISEGYACEYITKNSAPREAYSRNLIKGKYSLSYLRSLFKSSGSYCNCPINYYPCLICDEAHRLNEKSGLYSNMGVNQIMEIIRASKISIFFIDEHQIVSTKDIGTIDEIKKQAEALGSIVHCNESLVLSSQFRCNGSDAYLAFLDDLLGIRKTANYNYFDLDYDIRVFDDPNEMRLELAKTNIHNKSRMIAGYCYPWLSKEDKTQYDICLKNGFRAQWNFSTTQFAIKENTFDQVGCIHSTQGLEFDYVGIIIGKDMRYENGMVITDRTQRAKNDATIKGLKGNEALGDKIIRNTYRTLLSRGQKGCFIFCEDDALRDYIRKRLDMVKKGVGKEWID